MATIEDLRRSDRMIRQSAEALGVALAAVHVYCPPLLARSVQAEQNLYDRIAAEFGLLNASEVGRQMSSRSRTPRNLASTARSNGRLLGVRRGSRTVYPGFQFGADAQPLPVIRELLELAGKHGRSEVGVVQWLCAPTTYPAAEHQASRRPVDLLASDPDTVMEAAARSWGIEW